MRYPMTAWTTENQDGKQERQLLPRAQKLIPNLRKNGTTMTLNDLLQDFTRDRSIEISTQNHELIASAAASWIIEKYSEAVSRVTTARSLGLPVEHSDEQSMRELQQYIGRGNELASLIVPSPIQPDSDDPAQMNMSEYARWRTQQEFSRGQGIFDM
jgi:hypothetical protein